MRAGRPAARTPQSTRFRYTGQIGRFCRTAPSHGWTCHTFKNVNSRWSSSTYFKKFASGWPPHEYHGHVHPLPFRSVGYATHRFPAVFSPDCPRQITQGTTRRDPPFPDVRRPRPVVPATHSPEPCHQRIREHRDFIFARSRSSSRVQVRPTTGNDTGLSPTPPVVFRCRAREKPTVDATSALPIPSISIPQETRCCCLPPCEPPAHFPEKSSERSRRICYHLRVQG